jgi:RND family efflux transporter MFP subunit
MTMHKRWLDLILMAVVAAAAVGCSEEIETGPASAQPESPRLSLAATASAATEADFRTYLYSERDVDVFNRLGSGVYFEQGVVVRAIHVEVGDRVRAGQLLATLEDDEVKLELEAAEAKAEQAKAEFERIEELSEREFVSPSEYDEALYASRAAEIQLKRARLDMSRTQVRAPFAGVVARRYIRERELVEEGTPLFRVTAMSPLRARLLVPELHGAAFRIGAPALVAGANGTSATARVLVVGPTVDPGSGTREVIVELADANGFRPGATVTVAPSPEMEIEER